MHSIENHHTLGNLDQSKSFLVKFLKFSCISFLFARCLHLWQNSRKLLTGVKSDKGRILGKNCGQEVRQKLLVGGEARIEVKM